MAFQATYQSKLTVEEELTGIGLAENKDTVTHNALDTRSVLNADSDVPATTVAAFAEELSAGAATIDLTALSGTQGEVDGTGLKVQALKVIAAAANTEVVTVGDGAANGYELLGDGWTMDLAPGQEVLVYGNEAAPDISGTASDIDLASSDLDAIVNVIVVMG